MLSGDKQRISRGYDFMKVCRWLAARSDLILLLFDAHKLDISDEFKEVIESIRSDGDKCRCVLNKADEIDGENLVKVYGALMWNLGKILQTPEVARMYVGSFWDEEYKCKDLERLLNQDRHRNSSILLAELSAQCKAHASGQKGPASGAAGLAAKRLRSPS